jgi:phage terminase large subunit-like protein
MDDRTLYGHLEAALKGSWRLQARPEQLPPKGDDWNGWLYLAGRGAGKTRSGAEWVKECVETGVAGRIALVAPTAADARDVMVEGESGILAISSAWCMPTYEPSKRRLTWPNGAVATTFSSEEADRLRGPQHDLAWCDELGAWNDAQATWDMLQFGLRLGRHPRWLVTTTPKPIRLIRELLARADVVTVRGSTYDNEANLSPAFIEAIKTRYEGTRLGRQELHAELLEDYQGALWTRENLDANRVARFPFLKRVVVAVDPSGTNGKDGGDEIGIVVCGLGEDGNGYVLEDASLKASPDQWARAAVTAYHKWGADRLIAERNYGGAMVQHTIHSVDEAVAYKEITASRGKAQRAEPVAALFEQGRVKLVGSFTELEDQMCAFTTAGYAGDGSPDRADALVWALTELIIDAPVRGFSAVGSGLGAIGAIADAVNRPGSNCFIMIGLGGRNTGPEPSEEENYQLAREAYAEGALSGRDLQWFRAETLRREAKGRMNRS